MNISTNSASDAVARSIQAMNDLQKTIVDASVDQDKKLLNLNVESKVRQSNDETLGAAIDEMA